MKCNRLSQSSPVISWQNVCKRDCVEIHLAIFVEIHLARGFFVEIYMARGFCVEIHLVKDFCTSK